MGLSLPHILIALLAFALLFGTGKISALMGDIAKGIKSFKKGLSEEWQDEARPEPKVIDYRGNNPPTLPKRALRAAPKPRRSKRKAGKGSPPTNRTAPESWRRGAQ